MGPSLFRNTNQLWDSVLSLLQLLLPAVVGRHELDPFAFPDHPEADDQTVSVPADTNGGFPGS